MIEYIQNLIIEFSPIAITALTCLINWVMTFKKFKEINIKQDVKDSISELESENKKLQDEIKETNTHCVQLQKQLNEVLTELSKVEHK